MSTSQLDPQQNRTNVTVTIHHFVKPSDQSEYILRWSRFRKIPHFEIRFPSTGIVLLDGKSGVGKTSILEAISFVLYDNAGNSCYPRHERASKKKHEPTWVELYCPGISGSMLHIYRQRRPNLLRIRGDGIALQDDAAQAYIDRIFGSYNHWLVGGYLQQSQMSSFFSMSSDDKLALLQQMSPKESGVESFEALLAKTNDKIRETTSRHQEVEMQVKLYSEMYMRLYNQCPDNIKNQKLWTSEQLLEIFQQYSLKSPTETTYPQQLQLLLQTIQTKSNQKIQSIRTEISQLQMSIVQIKERLKQKEELVQRLQKVTQELEKMPPSQPLDQLEKELSNITEQILSAQASERRNQLLAAKTQLQMRLDQIPAETSPYSWSQLDFFERILSGPSREQIEQECQEIALAKKYQSQVQIYQYQESLRQQIQQLERQLETYPKTSRADEIEVINKKIWALSLQQKKLVCPKCKTALTYNNGRLEPFEEDVCSEHMSITDLQAQKTRLQEEEIRFQQRDRIEKKLAQLKQQLAQSPDGGNAEKPSSPPKYANVPVNQLDLKLSQLQQIKSDWDKILPDLTSVKHERQKLSHAQERAQLIREIDRLTKELSSLRSSGDTPVEIRSLETRRDEIQKKIQEIRSIETQRVALTATRDQLSNQIKSYPDQSFDEYEQRLKHLQSELELEVNTLKDWESRISAQLQVHQLVEIWNQHERYKKIYFELGARLASFQKIRATLIAAEYIILDSILEEINQTVSEILDILFTEPISVTVRSLKQLKTDARIKPQINCQIVCDGAECAKITDLSGGEGTRVSLALAIAFSRFSNNPFLLLDESLSTLDVVAKETAIKMIRKYLPNKLIIAVNHDTTVGVYDTVIKLTHKS